MTEMELRRRERLRLATMVTRLSRLHSILEKVTARLAL